MSPLIAVTQARARERAQQRELVIQKAVAAPRVYVRQVDWSEWYVHYGPGLSAPVGERDLAEIKVKRKRLGMSEVKLVDWSWTPIPECWDAE